MQLVIPDYLFTFNIYANIILLVGVLALIGFAAARIPAPATERRTTAALLGAGLLVWFAAALYLGRSNIYWAPENLSVPTIPFAILTPIALGLWLLLRFDRFARLIDAVPMSWLVGVQVYRSLGFMFLVLWWGGFLPWQFALPAGVGDVATGLLALVVAAMIARGLSGADSATFWWCVFGIADLVVAVGMGTLTSPGLTLFIATDAPNLLVTAYPLVMIPTFAVPLSIILHVMCLWKLRRAGAF